MVDLVKTQSQNSTARNRDIARKLRQKFPDQLVVPKNVENGCAIIKKENFGGYTPIQALIKAFGEIGAGYSIRYSDSDPGKLRSLFGR